MKRVYFLRPVGQLGPIKIGCSKLPELRLETLTVWSPVRLELICSVPGSHPDERALHAMFHKHRVHGEWFGASKELLALIDHCSLTGELPELPKVIAFPRTSHVGHRGRAKGKREPGELSPHKLEIARLMRGQHESGLTAQQIAAEHGKNQVTVARYIRAAGGTVRRGSPRTERGVADVARAETIRDRYLGGETLKQIGDSLGVSRERVRQILRKFNVESLGWRKHPPHQLTDAELLAIELYQADIPPREIVRRTGLRVHQVAYARRLAGIPSKSTAHWHTLPNDAEITQQVCDLYLAGKSGLEIVAAVPHLKFRETVYRYLKKGGVKPHRGSRHNRATAQRSATA